MFGKNRNKKVGLCVMVVTACLVLAGLWIVLATPETALAHKNDGIEHSHGKGGDGGGGGGGKGERTARVTISGLMETPHYTENGTAIWVEHSFGLDKDSKQTLELNSWSGADRGASVPIKFNFASTVAADNCICKEVRNNWEDGVVLDNCYLKAHLDDSVDGSSTS